MKNTLHICAHVTRTLNGFNAIRKRAQSGETVKATAMTTATAERADRAHMCVRVFERAQWHEPIHLAPL